MRRFIWIVPSVVVVILTGYLLARPESAPAEPARPNIATPPTLTNAAKPEDAKAAHLPSSPELPITQIILYSSGVGYFQREGTIVGSRRLDLSFPANDINDLLKSMVLQDLGGGHVSAVALDSNDPVEKTLSSFAIQLSGNPSNGEILNQARGETVEVTLTTHQFSVSANESRAVTAPTTIQGIVVGVEKKPKQETIIINGNDSGNVETLNLWCSDGMRSIPLANVQRLKFLNPALENEIRRALDVLASAHDSQKKAVSLQFNGTGPRPVRVGYVVETPLWRTSYRLLVDKEGKLFIQGWALVSNPSNEDWKDVRVGLVSGRPISFQMDLYQPLYVHRPVVEAELFGSIRPVVHSGPTLQSGAAGGGAVTGVPIAAKTAQTIPSGRYLDQAAPVQIGNGVKAEFGMEVGTHPQPTTTTFTNGVPVPPSNGVSSTTAGFPFNGSPLPAQPHVNFQIGVIAAATANDLGDAFQYAIEHPVTIPRQKSALLPIVNQPLEGDKVSVYSPQAHAKYPLLALRLKNTTGMSLMQGPVAVFEGTGYCGDAQLPNVQPNEDRLVSYALDLGTEVETVDSRKPGTVKTIRIRKGVLSVSGKDQETRTFTLKNRGPQHRTVLVEHPYRPGYTLVSKEKPKERASDVYRFEVKVATGRTAKLEVVEEKDNLFSFQLLQSSNLEPTVRQFLTCEFSDEKVKAALEKWISLQDTIKNSRQESALVQKQLSDITADQARLRANLKEMPPSAAAYNRYLEKFDSQETTIEKLQAQIQDLQKRVQQELESCDAYLTGLDLQATIRFAGS